MARFILVAVALLIGARTVSAETDDEAAAREFSAAQDDFAASRYDAACTKLETSVRLRMQVRPLGLLAACYEKQGRLATAWRTFKDVRRRADGLGDPDLAAAAAEHVARLEPKLARLTLQVPDRVDGLVIKLDGSAVASSELDKPFELDAGVHVLVVSATNGQASKQDIPIRDGELKHVTVPKLAPTPASEPVPSKPPTETPTPTPSPRPGEHGRRKLVGLATLGAGVLVLGVGGYFGLSARSTWNDARDAGCADTGRCPTQAGVDLVDDAHGKGRLSTLFIVAGAVVAATGVVLWVTAPRRAERRTSVAPVVGQRTAGLVLRGAF
ncbi:MAG: hypothetical protein H6Q90_4544 [Deltaproteobacteria bacterium]|nr:hypothetical protein [Deltaproteobacteria bacterium]